MELTYFGGTTIRIKGKSAAIVVDPNTKIAKQEADIVAQTNSVQASPEVIKSEFVLVDGPGEYEVKGINVVGVAQKPTETESNTNVRVTAYVINVDSVNSAHFGNFTQAKLAEDQLEELENVDIVLLPINHESGFEPSAAAKIAAQVEARIIIPLFPSGKNEELVKEFLKEMGKESIEPIKKLTITKDKLPEEPQVVLLDES